MSDEYDPPSGPDDYPLIYTDDVRAAPSRRGPVRPSKIQEVAPAPPVAASDEVRVRVLRNVHIAAVAFYDPPDTWGDAGLGLQMREGDAASLRAGHRDTQWLLDHGYVRPA